MMDTHTWTLLYLRDCDQARDSDTIGRWFALLLASGYAIHADPVAAVFDPNYVASPGVPADVRRNLYRYLEGRAKSFSFALTREPLATTIDCSLHPEEGILFLDVSDQNLGDQYTGGHGVDCYALWLALIEQTYALWRPFYGFVIGDAAEERFTTRDAALALDVSYLYTHLNIFGPELVEMLGRDRLATAPADYRRAFSDGGVLLAPVTYHDLARSTDGAESGAAKLTLQDVLRTAHSLGMDARDWNEYFHRWRAQ